MKNLVPIILSILLLWTSLSSSPLRVESMGGVTICIRDEENDPIAVNPARVSFVKKTKLLGSIAPSNRSYKSESKEEYKTTPPIHENNRYYESENSASILGIDGLGYIKPSAMLGLGAKIGYFNESSKNFNNYRKVGKWEWEWTDEGPKYEYISTATYQSKHEDTSSLNPINLNLLAGYNLGIVTAGLSLNLTPSYKITTENKYTQIDDEYYVPFSTVNVDSSKYETTQSRNIITLGTVLQPTDEIVLDVVLGFELADSESRQVSDVENNVEQWKDDKDLYPVKKTKISKTNIGLLFNYKISEIFIIGAGVKIVPGEITDTMEMKVIKYDSAKTKSQEFVISPGIGITPTKTAIIGAELSIHNTTVEKEMFSLTGSKISTVKENFSMILARIGAEKYVIEDVLAIRLGAVKVISFNRESKEEIENKVEKDTFYNYGPISIEYLSPTSITWNYFSAGLAFKVAENIILEYGLIDSIFSPFTKHQVLVKVMF